MEATQFTFPYLTRLLRIRYWNEKPLFNFWDGFKEYIHGKKNIMQIEKKDRDNISALSHSVCLSVCLYICLDMSFILPHKCTESDTESEQLSPQHLRSLRQSHFYKEKFSDRHNNKLLGPQHLLKVT